MRVSKPSFFLEDFAPANARLVGEKLRFNVRFGRTIKGMGNDLLTSLLENQFLGMLVELGLLNKNLLLHVNFKERRLWLANSERLPELLMDGGIFQAWLECKNQPQETVALAGADGKISECGMTLFRFEVFSWEEKEFSFKGMVALPLEKRSKKPTSSVS